MGDDPPFLSVGTEVSAKYKGAFCEAKVRKVVKSIKCKVMFKLGLGSAVVSDDQIKGLLRVGAQVEAKHPEKAQFLEAVINKIQDCSQYTVVFDDGDITTLRRTSLCLKSGRHFAESETLDQLPLTHPEHFGTPVLGGRRGGRRRDDSSDEDGDEDSELGRLEKSGTAKKNEDREPNIGKIVCVEVSEKKKGKETWFPGLIVAPTAQDAVSIRVKDEYLVRSFKDARYYTVPKKEAMEFTREIALKTEHNALKTAIEKAMQYLDKNELPAHWDREVLFGLDDVGSVNESKGGSDADSSEDETREEKDHFVAQLYKFMDDNGTPINKGPTINSRDLDLYRLFKIVNKMGGFNRVTNQNGWKTVTQKLILNSASNSSNHVKQAYKKYLYGFEDFYRKLGCTMNSPRGPKSRARPGRSLIRDRDRATSGSSTPKGEAEDEEKIKIEEIAPVPPPPVPEVEVAVEAPPVVDEETSPAPVEEEEVDESSSSVSQPPARRQRERSLPLRLQDTITTKLPIVKKEEESGGDDTNEQEVESNSSQSVRSQRGTRSRIPREKSDETEQPETSRPGRKRGKSRVEEKTNEDEDKSSRVKVKEEPPANGKEEVEKKPKVSLKDDTERKNKTPGRENKNKGRKVEDIAKTEDTKKTEEESTSADPDEPTPKRRGRKPRTLADSEDDEGGRLPANVDVQIGDKLKVYYGPMQDAKVTYEAKVCEIRVEGTNKLFLVHYTGWNTRYDEWIKRARIAENLTWTPNRKRSKSVHSQGATRTTTTVPGGKAAPAKRGRTRGQDSSRSATPSSVTSTSSTGQRNANVASSEDSGNKRPPSKNSRRRSRRISEMSTLSAESLDSSDEEEEEEGTVRVRKKPAKKASVPVESEESEPVDIDESDRTPRRRHQRRRISESEQTSSENKPSEPPAGDVVVPVSSLTPVRRGRRRAVTAPEATSADPIPVKEEPDDTEKASTDAVVDLNASTGEEPKGKDFDLKKIRSELKMAVDIAPTAPAKATSPTPSPLPPPVPVAFPTVPSIPTVSPPAQQPLDPLASGHGGGDDDIYEFREPEPFEFEVRARRESPFSEDRVHHRFAQRKSTKEEEEEVASPKKQATAPVRAGSVERNKSVITSPPRGARPCLTATALSVAPSESSETTQPAQSTSCLSPVPLPIQINTEVISVAPSTDVQSPPLPPPSLSSSSTTATTPPPPPTPPTISTIQIPIPITPTTPPSTTTTTPNRPISPKLEDPLIEKETSTEEQQPTQLVTAKLLDAPVISPSSLPHPMPALSALAARSVTAASRPPVVFAHKSVSPEVKPEKAEEEEEEDEEEEDRDADEEEEEEIDSEETVVTDDVKSNKSPVKRERRKTGARKAISREFIESDEDSPEDPGASCDSTPKAIEEEKASSDSTPSEAAEDDDLADKSSQPDDLLMSRKPTLSCSGLSKLKTEEDLDENSLLCEETIPGSPVTHSAALSSDCPDSSVLPVPSTSRSTEMPFASAPSAPNMPRTRGLSGVANVAGRANRKRGLRQALAMQRPGIRPVAGSSLVMENTPPTTPDGSISSSSSSPQGDHGGMSPDHDSSVKSEREFSENDNVAPSAQGSQIAVEVPAIRNIGPRASATAQPLPPPAIKRREDEANRQMQQQQQHQEEESPVKRRRRGGGSGGASDQTSARRGRGHGRSPRRTGSDSEDTATDYANPSSIGSGCINMTNYQPRSTRYNFCTDLDPELDASQRIASLQDKLRELRQTYSALKARVMLIDRRRKKLKRKEKEASS